MSSEFTAKAKGAAKQAATALKGQTGIFATLAKEHGEVSSLINQALKSSKREDQRGLISKIRLELLSHAKAEEQTLYNTLLNHPATRDIANDAKSEHDQLEAIMRRLTKLPVGEAEWVAALEELRETVEHHVKEEEGMMFPKADEALSKSEQDRIHREFKTAKEVMKRNLEGDGGMYFAPQSAR